MTPRRALSRPRIATTQRPSTGPPIHHGNCSFISARAAPSRRSRPTCRRPGRPPRPRRGGRRRRAPRPSRSGGRRAPKRRRAASSASRPSAIRSPIGVPSCGRSRSAGAVAGAGAELVTGGAGATVAVGVGCRRGRGVRLRGRGLGRLRGAGFAGAGAGRRGCGRLSGRRGPQCRHRRRRRRPRPAARRPARRSCRRPSRARAARPRRPAERRGLFLDHRRDLAQRAAVRLDRVVAGPDRRVGAVVVIDALGAPRQVCGGHGGQRGKQCERRHESPGQADGHARKGTERLVSLCAA